MSGGGDDAGKRSEDHQRQRLRDQLMQLNRDRNELESEMREYGDILKSVSVGSGNNSPVTVSLFAA